MNLDFDLILLISALLFIFTIVLNIYWLAKNTQIGVIKRLVTSLIFLGIAIVAPALTYFNSTPNIASSTPVTEGILADYTNPVTVVFNVPVDSTRLTANITPDLKGHWVWKPYLGISRMTRVGYFYPGESLFQGQRVVIYITGIGRVGLPAEGHEGGFVFDSAKLPEVASITPDNKAMDVKSNQAINLTYDKALDNLVDINYKLSPEIEVNVTKIDEMNFKIEPKSGWQLSTHYTLSIERTDKRLNLETKEELEHDNPVVIHEYEFDTQKEPLISHFSPEGKDVRVNSQIKMLFFADMDHQSVQDNLLINPAIEGDYQWLSDKALVFTPKVALPNATQFTVLLSKGTKSKSGNSTDKEVIYYFETLGKVNIIDYSPFNNEVKVNEKSFIRITLNQEVDHNSFQSLFSMTPNVNGEFAWAENNTVAFIPVGGLAFDTKYTVSIQPGIKSLFGFDSTDTFNFSFTTRRNEVTISMPLYYQPQYPVSFSCNIYASMMALAWKGYRTTASGLIGEIGNDASQNSGGQWLANPNEVYVGNADGSWGYGVYWNAIKKVFTSRGITTEIHENWNLSALAKAVEAGHPVQIWRYNGTSADHNLAWGTSGVYAINGQHGGVVTGFRGTSDNPTAIYINDPWFGLVWMDSSTFDYYWSRLNRVGLVIF